MKSTKSRALISFVVFILVFGITHFAAFPGSVEHFKDVTNDQKLLDLKPEFSAHGVYDRLDAFGDDGRAAYLKLIPTIDIIFPICAFIFFLMLGQLAKEDYPQSLYARYYWTLPSTYLLMDFIENSLVVLMLVNYPERMDSVASVLGFISVTKRVFMILSFGIPLLLLLFVTIQHWRKAHTRTDKNPL